MTAENDAPHQFEESFAKGFHTHCETLKIEPVSKHLGKLQQKTRKLI